MFKENEINNDENQNAVYGIKTYVPSSLVGSYQYWKNVANQAFYLTLVLGALKFFVTVTFNPKSNEMVALNTESNLVHNSPLVARLFNQRKVYHRLYKEKWHFWKC